jgi:hypothetical protein
VTALTHRTTLRIQWRMQRPGAYFGAGLLLTLLVLLGLPAFFTLHGISHHSHESVVHVHGDADAGHGHDHHEHGLADRPSESDEPSHDDTCAICVELLIAKTLGIAAVLCATVVQETLVDRPIVPAVVRAPEVDRPRSACTRGPPCIVTVQA